jgi:glycosyltransferase involved in cell wall biosynthesis
MAQEIARLLDDPGERLAMGEMGREIIRRRLSWDMQEPRYITLVDSLVEPAGGKDMIQTIGAER